MKADRPKNRLGIIDRVNHTILRQYARSQSYAAATPRLVPDPGSPQNVRLRAIRWAVNATMSGSGAAAIGFTVAWKMRVQSASDSPDFLQSAAIVGAAIAGWCGAEALRILMPREFDLGEKATFGHRWKPDQTQPNTTPPPSLTARALKQSYGLTMAIATATVALLSLELPYAWPAAAVITAAIAGEYLLGQRNDQGEWQSLTDRISGMRHCLKRPAAPPPAPTRPGAGGGKRTSRRKRSQGRRAAQAQNGAKP